MGCTWLTCDFCGRDFLVPDAWVVEMGKEPDIVKKECQRCRDLSCQHHDELFEMEKEAWRAARKSE